MTTIDANLIELQEKLDKLYADPMWKKKMEGNLLEAMQREVSIPIHEQTSTEQIKSIYTQFEDKFKKKEPWHGINVSGGQGGGASVGGGGSGGQGGVGSWHNSDQIGYTSVTAHADALRTREESERIQNFMFEQAKLDRIHDEKIRELNAIVVEQAETHKDLQVQIDELWGVIRELTGGDS